MLSTFKFGSRSKKKEKFLHTTGKLHRGRRSRASAKHSQLFSQCLSWRSHKPPSVPVSEQQLKLRSTIASYPPPTRPSAEFYVFSPQATNATLSYFLQTTGSRKLKKHRGLIRQETLPPYLWPHSVTPLCVSLFSHRIKAQAKGRVGWGGRGEWGATREQHEFTYSTRWKKSAEKKMYVCFFFWWITIKSRRISGRHILQER